MKYVCILFILRRKFACCKLQKVHKVEIIFTAELPTDFEHPSGSSAQNPSGPSTSSQEVSEALGTSGGFISAVDENADTIALPEVHRLHPT